MLVLYARRRRPAAELGVDLTAEEQAALDDLDSDRV